MAEQYTTVRDGYVTGNVAVGKAKARSSTTPSYVKSLTGPQKGLSGKELWDALDAMSSRIIH